MISSIPLRIVTILLTALAVLQLALIFGAPLGRAAWGGQHDVLPASLRISSVFSILIYIGIIWVARQRLKKPAARLFRSLSWVLAIYFFLGVVLNLASSSIWEKMIMAPIALALAICMQRIARAR